MATGATRQRYAQTGDDAALRDAGYDCKRCVASPCGYAARVWPCPPPGTGVPVWRLRALRRAWPAGACPPAPRISAIGLGAMGHGGYDGSALNSERAACAALQLYQYIDVPLDCRAARRWYVPADGDALRSAVSAALRPRRQLHKLITAPLVRQERFAPLTRVLPRGMRQQASSSASRSA